MSAYQTFLPDCDCGHGNGILFKDNIPCCRWCLKSWGHGGMINYNDESFQQSKQPLKPEVEQVSGSNDGNEKYWLFNCSNGMTYQTTSKRLFELLSSDDISGWQEKPETGFPQQIKPDTKDGKMPIKFSKEESNFIQATFNLTANWYWTDFYFKKVDDSSYELWEAEKLPASLKKIVKPKEYTQQQLDEAIQKAFEAARLHHPLAGLKFDNAIDYINSLNTNSKTYNHVK